MTSLAALLTVASTIPANAAEPDSDPTPDAVLQTYIESHRIPGVVALAATKDRVLHQAAVGRLDMTSDTPVALDTLFRIASMTKPVTSVAIMQLVEKKRVELEAPVDRYLPELSPFKVLTGFDDSGKPRLRDAARPPTIRELLSNTSGYAYSIWNRDQLRYEQYIREERNRREVGKDEFPMRLASDPGTRWEYSPSTMVLGQVVERVSELSLEEYFHQHIFTPLAMQDSFFQVPDEKWSRVARLHQRWADGTVAPIGSKPPSKPPRVRAFRGDGGLISTGPDYLRFIRALLNGGELDGARILTPESVELMSQNQIGDFRAGEMISVVPNVSNDVHLFPGATNKFGLGFLINAQPVAGGRAAGSLMWAGAFNTYFWIDLQQGVGGVIMTQLTPFADPTVLGLLENYEKAVYALPR